MEFSSRRRIRPDPTLETPNHRPGHSQRSHKQGKNILLTGSFLSVSRDCKIPVGPVSPSSPNHMVCLFMTALVGPVSFQLAQDSAGESCESHYSTNKPQGWPASAPGQERWKRVGHWSQQWNSTSSGTQPLPLLCRWTGSGKP